MNVTQVPRSKSWLASTDRYPDYSHAAFAYKLRLQILPNDEEHREGFDNGTEFRIELVIPMFTSMRLLRNHMKSQGILVDPGGTSCLASSWPG